MRKHIMFMIPITKTNKVHYSDVPLAEEMLNKLSTGWEIISNTPVEGGIVYIIAEPVPWR